MRLIVVAVRDSAVDAFSRPFFVPSVQMAHRSFVDEVNRPESEMFRHPGDYELFQLAEFDEESGRFTNLETPRAIVRATDVFRKGGVN